MRINGLACMNGWAEMPLVKSRLPYTRISSLQIAMSFLIFAFIGWLTPNTVVDADILTRCLRISAVINYDRRTSFMKL